MVDVNPYGQIQKFSGRQADLVDAIAEQKRVVDAVTRANPLIDAWVDRGLMRWRGNYAANNESFLWIGEFHPQDNVLGKEQRGFVLSRDDPKHATALWMYDPNAEAASPSGPPLRQRIFMNDADNRPIMREAAFGGVSFPTGPIPLMPFADTRFIRLATGAGAGDTLNSRYVPVPNEHATTGGNRIKLYEGTGPMTGPWIRILGWMQGLKMNDAASVGIGVDVTISWDDGSVYNSVRQDVTDAGAYFDFTLNFSTFKVTGQNVQVSVWGTGITGGDQWTIVQPYQCFSFEG